MSIDLNNEFIQASIKTESTIDKVVVDKALLVQTLQMHIATGNMLDQMKKHIFYGSQYNLPKYGNTMDENCKLVKEISTSMNIDGLYTLNRDDEDTLEDIDPRIIHALIGIATESSELCEALLSYVNGEELDLANVGEENGDIAWYQAIFYDASGLNWEQSLETVITKLTKRYNGQFSKAAAETRNLTAEREILESGIKQK